MNQIKADLISEIIRISQTNLLGRKRANEGGVDEQCVVDWIKENAANYRTQFETRLDPLSASELGDLLNTLTCSGKDLSEVLNNDRPAGSKGNGSAGKS